MVPNAPNSLLIVRVVFRNVTPSYGDEESTLVRLSPELVFVRGMLLLYCRSCGRCTFTLLVSAGEKHADVQGHP